MLLRHCPKIFHLKFGERKTSLLPQLHAASLALVRTCLSVLQLMSGCLGERPYREYLESVAAAQRECGGGVGDGGFFPGLFSATLTPSLAAHFPAVQVCPFL